MSELFVPQQYSGNTVNISHVNFFNPPGHYRATKESLLSHSDVLRIVNDMEPGSMTLVRKEFKDVRDDYSLEALFTQDENMRRGREESGNEIVFGQLLLNSIYDQARTKLIAAKPVENNKIAVHEFATSEYLNGLNRRTRPQLTFIPIGFWKDDNGTPIVLTNYEHDVQSYDGLFWHGDESDLTKDRIEHAIGRCILALGTTHYLGLVHRDAQIKNFAVDNKGIRIIDVETFRSFKETNGSADPLKTHQDIVNDLRTFAGSLVSRLDNFNELQTLKNTIETTLSKKAHSYTTIVNLPTSRVPEAARLTEEETVHQFLLATQEQ